MEVRIGVQNVAREIIFESSQSVDDVARAVSDALAEGAVLNLTDDKGRRYIIPTASLAYVHIGEAEKGRVGFGTI